MDKHCPINSDQMHHYFLFEVKSAFEPVSPMLEVTTDDKPFSRVTKDLYERVEYSISACSCGKVIKQKVKTNLPDET